MNNRVSTERQRLIDYAKAYLGMTCHPNEPVAVTVELIADFADLLRRGCAQDIIRLIGICIKETVHPEGRAALRSLGEGIQEAGVGLWGLPDCECDRVDCVYCGPRIAKRMMTEKE